MTLIIYPIVFVCFILFLILLWSFIKILSQDFTSYEQGYSKLEFWYHSGINGIVMLVWILLLIESSPLNNRISDYGAPFGAVLLLLIVPLGLLIAWMYRRRQTKAVSLLLRKYMNKSKIFWSLSTIPGLLLVAFYTLIMLSDR